MALSLLLTRTTGLVVPSTGLFSRPALTAPLSRLQMVSDAQEWEELDGGDTSESWEEQMAAMREWEEATKDTTPDPVAPAASESDPDDVASALADVGAAMVQLGRSVEVLAATLNGASPPPAASPASPAASQEQERVLLSSDELLSTVPAAVASLLEGRMVKSTSAPSPSPPSSPPPPSAPPPSPPPPSAPPPSAPPPSAPPPSPPPSAPPKAAAAGFMGTAAESNEDAAWFRQEGEGPTELSALMFDDEGDCLVDMPDWRSVRAEKLGKPAPPEPTATAPRGLSEGVAAAAAAAAAEMAKSEAAKKARLARLAEQEGTKEWDGTADEGAYFDYDIDDDLPDWRESRN